MQVSDTCNINYIKITITAPVGAKKLVPKLYIPVLFTQFTQSDMRSLTKRTIYCCHILFYFNFFIVESVQCFVDSLDKVSRTDLASEAIT